MNIGAFLVFLAAIGGAALLEIQEQRHRYQLGTEYRQKGKPMPAPRPKIRTLEAVLNVLAGVILLGVGLMFFWTMAQLEDKGPGRQGSFNSMALFIGLGLAMVVVGTKAVGQNIRYKKTGSAE
jgi:uncharacterized membrane protein YidH (DUF202 family)